MRVVATRVGWAVGDDSKRYLELALEDGGIVQLEFTAERAMELAEQLTARPPASFPGGVH